MCLNLRKSSGYTLVELMVSLVLSAIAVIVIYRSFIAFRVGAEIQAQESEINQNLRVGMNRLGRELQMAGYDPTGSAEAGFIAPLLPAEVTFTADYNIDGDLSVGLLGTPEYDSDFNGNPFEDDNVTYSWDGTDGSPLRRTDNNLGITETVIPNVSALAFYYLDEDDAQTAVLDEIRSVHVFLVVKATNEDFSYENTTLYETPPPYNDTLLNVATSPANEKFFRRKMIARRVKARNMGLE